MQRILLIVLFYCNFLMANSIELHIKNNKNLDKHIKDLNLIGEWHIKTEKYFTNFILTSGNRWDISFEKNHEILLRKQPRQMYWDYDNQSGKIKIYNDKIITLYGGDEIILKEYLGNKCFNADLNKNTRIKMCKTKGNILNNIKDLVKIEMN